MKKIIDHLKENWIRHGFETLVVILGILVAFNLNNWNERIKKEKRKKDYIESLIGDLQRDTLELGNQIRAMERDLEILDKLSERLSNRETNIDSLVQIARFEFMPYFNPVNSLNNSTYLSIQNNGDIDLLDPWLIKALAELNLKQLNCLKVVDANFGIFLRNVNSYSSKFGYDEGKGIKGPLMDEAWKHTNPYELTFSINSILTSKRLMEMIVISIRLDLYNETRSLLDTLNKISIDINLLPSESPDKGL